MTATVEEFLEHYGVKGMKWGQRKSKAPREAASEDAAKVGNIHSRVKAQKSTKPLSNKELQDAITRMNLEQQYSRLSNGLDKTRAQKASAFVSQMIGTAGKQTAQQIATNEVKKATAAAVAKSAAKKAVAVAVL